MGFFFSSPLLPSAHRPVGLQSASGYLRAVPVLPFGGSVGVPFFLLIQALKVSLAALSIKLALFFSVLLIQCPQFFIEPVLFQLSFGIILLSLCLDVFVDSLFYSNPLDRSILSCWSWIYRVSSSMIRFFSSPRFLYRLDLQIPWYYPVVARSCKVAQALLSGSISRRSSCRLFAFLNGHLSRPEFLFAVYFSVHRSRVLALFQIS